MRSDSIVTYRRFGQAVAGLISVRDWKDQASRFRTTPVGVEICNLELYGGTCWIPTDLTTYTLSPRINGIGNDGTLLAGGET
jgi:hypothetical protein